MRFARTDAAAITAQVGSRDSCLFTSRWARDRASLAGPPKKTAFHGESLVKNLEFAVWIRKNFQIFLSFFFFTPVAQKHNASPVSDPLERESLQWPQARLPPDRLGQYKELESRLGCD